MNRTLLLLTMSLCISHLISAQRTITGFVTSADGVPLIGASVVVVGTTVGAVSDVNGSYSITVPDEGTSLRFSYTGFFSRDVELGPGSVVDISLSTGVYAIDEVVVTAAGIERQRKDLGYSVSTVDGEEFTIARETNIVNALQGKTSGVQITSQSGNLGGTQRSVRGD